MSNLTPGELISQFGSNPAKEPALAIGTTTGTVAGVLTLVLYLFPEIPNGTLKIIFVVVAVLLPIISAIATRGKVWSPDSVQKLVEEAVESAIEAKKQMPQGLLKNPRPITTEEEANFRTGFNRDTK